MADESLAKAPPMRYALRVGVARRHLVGCGIVAAVLALLAGCGSDDDHQSSTSARFAVLSAFPAELAAVLEFADVDETRTIDNHVFRLGRIGGVRVVVAMTGIGLVNASNTTAVLLDNFDVDGVVVSGVAGTPYRIGDVAVPEHWALADGNVFDCHAPWLDVARLLTPPGTLTLETCTELPSSGELVCLPFEPVVAVGGTGHSADTYGEHAVACTPGSGDVFGCDGDAIPGAAQASEHRASLQVTPADALPSVQDMETAAIGREAFRHRVPFIAFRATSDGSDDPLHLVGNFTEFFAYYRLAAKNAATATAAFLDRVDKPGR